MTSYAKASAVAEAMADKSADTFPSNFESKVAEREGFEPPGPCGPAVFKTAAIDHSATSPEVNRANKS
jgi:hypothetical protein